MSLESDWDSAVPIGRAPGGDLKAQWDKAEPIKFKKPKEEPRTPEDPTSAGNLAGAAVEPMMAMGSGAVMGPLSGLAGLAGTMIPGPPGQGADWQKKIASAAYEPKSTGGRNAMSAIAAPFDLMNKGAAAVGEKTTDVTGSPLAGTAAHTLIEALPQFFGAKGMRAGMGAVDRGMESAGLRKPPKIDPDADALMKRGIPVTPGQIDPRLARAEESSQSIPFFGDSVKGARARGVEALNREAWNDALKPLGQKLPKNLTGEEAAEFTRRAYEDAYGDLTVKLKGSLDIAPPRAPAPPGGIAAPPSRGTFRQELNKILDKAGQPGELPTKELRVLRRIIEKDVKEAFDKGGRADGDRLKAIHETLRTQREKFGKAQDAYQRDLASRIELVEEAMRQMYRDQNPSYAGQLSKIDDGYARFKIAQKAAGAVGSKEGTFKPSTYDRAVRDKDPSKDKRAYTEGNARQQDLSGPGRRVLSDTLPDSGTPIRVAVMKMLQNPKEAMAFAAGIGVPISMLYSPMGIELMTKMMTGKVQPGRGLGTALPLGAANAGNQLQPPPE